MGETTRLTLREASERTGIPLDALRKRVYRGTIPAEKIDGQYTIVAGDLAAITTGHESSQSGETTDETRPRTGSDTGETRDRTAGETAPDPLTLDYISSLKDEITFLREQLDQRSRELAAERQRADVIQQLALQRIPQLATGETRHDPPQTPQDVHSEPEAANATPDPSQSERSWWRRLLGIE